MSDESQGVTETEVVETPAEGATEPTLASAIAEAFAEGMAATEQATYGDKDGGAAEAGARGEAGDGEDVGADASEGDEKDAGATADDSSTPEGADADDAEEELNYTVGDGGELHWSEGATLRFKADKREVEVTSLTDLVTLAQKGVFMDRRTQEWATERGQHEHRIGELEGQVQEQAKLIEVSEEALLKILFDEEALEMAREMAKPHRNPEKRRADKAEAELERRSEADKARAQKEADAASERYWTGVGEQFESMLEEDASDYPFLRAEDAPHIQQGVYNAYATFRAEIEKALVAGGRSAEEAALQSTEAAVTWLAEEEAETIRRVAEELNAVYAERLPAGASQNGSGGKRDSDPKADPEKHNRKTDAQLKRRRQGALRGSGAAGGTGSGSKPKELPSGGHDDDRTHAGMWDDINREFEEFLKAE